mgnify:CR=1 FL=1
MAKRDVKLELLKLYKWIKDSTKSHSRVLALSTFLKETQDEYMLNSDGEEVSVDEDLISTEFDDYSDYVTQAEEYYFKKLPQEQRALLSEMNKKFDGQATKEDCIADLRRLKEEYPLSISRNFYRENGKYSDATWSRFFGTFHEFRRQAGLELNRHQHAAEKGIAKHASVDHYRAFYQEQLTPFHKKYVKDQLPTRFKRIFVLSDLHDVDVDNFTLGVCIAECKRRQPDVIVLNGDIYDLYEFSRFTQDIRNVDIVGRFNFVKDRILRPLREACPNAQIDFIAGNHEFRLITLLADQTPGLRVLLHDVMGVTCNAVFGLDEFQINWVSKFDLGAFTKFDAKKEISKNFKVYYGCYAVTHEPDPMLKKTMSGTHGHHHRASLETSTCVLSDSSMQDLSWVQTPAMCVPDAEYLRKIPSWNRGFLEVVIDTERKQVQQKLHICNEDWVEIDGIVYDRKKQ